MKDSGFLIVADRIFGNNILDTPKQDGGLVTSSTARVPIVEFGTMGIATNWLGFLEIRTNWSIMLGIHQAKNNEGRILKDSELNEPLDESDDNGAG